MLVRANERGHDRCQMLLDGVGPVWLNATNVSADRSDRFAVESFLAVDRLQTIDHPCTVGRRLILVDLSHVVGDLLLLAHFVSNAVQCGLRSSDGLVIGTDLIGQCGDGLIEVYLLALTNLQFVIELSTVFVGAVGLLTLSPEFSLERRRDACIEEVTRTLTMRCSRVFCSCRSSMPI